MNYILHFKKRITIWNKKRKTTGHPIVSAENNELYVVVILRRSIKKIGTYLCFSLKTGKRISETFVPINDNWLLDKTDQKHLLAEANRYMHILNTSST